VFSSIISEVSKKIKTNTTELNFSGATPKVIFKNIFSYSKNKSSIKHITGDIHYMALITGKNTVLTIHDSGSAIKGNIIKRFYVKLFWFWLPAFLVSRITVISEFTKGELEKIIPFSKKKIRVVYNPLSPMVQFSVNQFNAEQPKILCIGTKSNKNLERLILAVSELNCEITIVGKLTNAQQTLLNVHRINYINKFDLSFQQILELYKKSDIVSFVSTYEGFGMPIIESQAIGRPVITSNFGAMKEIAGDGACYIDPYDIDSIRNGLLTVINNKDYRDNLIQEGLSNANRFKPEIIGSKYYELYKEVLNS
jgi:glycosyltransferase involved in cell wall biosynthesis